MILESRFFVFFLKLMVITDFLINDCFSSLVSPTEDVLNIETRPTVTDDSESSEYFPNLSKDYKTTTKLVDTKAILITKDTRQEGYKTMNESLSVVIPDDIETQNYTHKVRPVVIPETEQQFRIHTPEQTIVIPGKNEYINVNFPPQEVNVPQKIRKMEVVTDAHKVMIPAKVRRILVKIPAKKVRVPGKDTLLTVKHPTAKVALPDESNEVKVERKGSIFALVNKIKFHFARKPYAGVGRSDITTVNEMSDIPNDKTSEIVQQEAPTVTIDNTKQDTSDNIVDMDNAVEEPIISNSSFPVAADLTSNDPAQITYDSEPYNEDLQYDSDERRNKVRLVRQASYYKSQKLFNTMSRLEQNPNENATTLKKKPTLNPIDARTSVLNNKRSRVKFVGSCKKSYQCNRACKKYNGKNLGCVKGLCKCLISFTS